MSSISLSLKMMLAASACAGLTLLACGEESSGGDEDSKNEEGKTGSTKNDGGTKKSDASVKRDAGLLDNLPEVAPGEECDTTTPAGQFAGKCEDDQCDSPPCLARCAEGVYTECKPQAEWLTELLRDGGLNGILGDAGLSGIIRDGGLTGILGDSGLTGILGDAGPIGGECPASEMCASSSSSGTAGLIVSAVAPPGQGICTAGAAPKECADPSDCTGGTCFDGNMIASQLPGGTLGFTLLGWPVKFCMVPCKP